MFLRQLLPFVLSGNNGRVTDALLQVDKFIFYGLYLIYKHAYSSLSAIIGHLLQHGRRHFLPPYEDAPFQALQWPLRSDRHEAHAWSGIGATVRV